MGKMQLRGHSGSWRLIKKGQKIALSLTFLLMLILCGCTSLSTAEGLEQDTRGLPGRLFDIRFDDSTPVTVRLDRTGLPDAKKTYRVRI